MSFTEIPTYAKALKYIKKQGVELGRNERKNIKTMYEHALKNDLIIGVQTCFCPFCNTTSDGGGLQMRTKGPIKEEILKMMCMNCMELSKILVGAYNLNAEEFHRVMDVIKDIKLKRGL